MNSYIEASHERCRLKDIKKENKFSTKIIKGEELKKKLEENKELITTAAPFLNHLYDFVKGANFFAILNDAEGCILKVIGDKDILTEATKLKMIPGAYMDEEHIGTNAMSIVLSEEMPVQLSGKEHYIHAYHKWTCSAAPIKGRGGNIIGIIDLTGSSDGVHPHTLGMVVAGANAIERMLEINKYNSELELSKKRIETIFDTISSGMLSSDLQGNIITMNKQVVKMFGYSEYELKNMKIWELLKDWRAIENKLQARENFTDEDVYVNARVNKLQFTLTAYPIYDGEKNIKEIVYVFNELIKGRKLAGKILSGQAIYTFDKIIGRDKNFQKTVEYAKKVADSKSTVLLSGESGTGKELFAQAIHNYSIRKEEAFIAVNCGAIPRTLIESEMFGYEEGAFTGARKGGNAGKFELADGGTIFLDEIGEMPIDMQIRLLRAIEEGVINRIGSPKQIPVNVRIIAATNKELKEEVAKGNFRKDLFYRLNVLPVTLPPLRQRKEDIPLLVNYYMNKTSKKLNKRSVNISDEYMNYLQNYDWPGNIRELENVIELIVNTETLQLNLWNKESEEQVSASKIGSHQSLEQMEMDYIITVLKEVKGNITLAAKILDIGRNTLYRKIEKHEIDCSTFEQCSEMEQEL
jgi:sigma-54 dependent transcriptional regulator, acetoin dehydrogenase operon transcriptional activator AcoR